MEMYKKYLVLFLVSSSLLCAKKEINHSEESERPLLGSVDQKVEITKNDSCIEEFVDSIKTLSVDTIKKGLIRKREVKRVDTVKVIELKNDVITKKDECYIEQPKTMSIREKPNTVVEAEDWARWMYKKAKCFKMKNVDSCFIYTQRGIKTFENGSLFYLKAFCLLQSGSYSASKTAAEICLSRRDHWMEKDKEDVLLVKIEALQGLQKNFPSKLIEKEIINAQDAYATINNN